MKKKALIFAAVALLFAVAIYKWRNPPLRMPTPAQIAETFPDHSQAIFDGADQLIIYSVDPLTHATLVRDNGASSEATITDSATLKRLREEFYNGIAVDRGTFRTACFSPRHGIRAVKNGRTLDLLICFECFQVQPIVDGKTYETGHMNRKPQNAFNRIYSDAGLKLAP